MRRSLCCCALVALSLAGVVPLGAQQTGPRNDRALRDTLVRIVLDMYAGWEPQSGSVTDAIARGHKHFVTDSTFAMIIDATYRASYDQWVARTAISIPTDFREYREQHHLIRDARLLPLGERGAALTIFYCVDFVKTDGSRGTVKNGATLVFIRLAAGWKIAQYHGSHGVEIITDTKCAYS